MLNDPPQSVARFRVLLVEDAPIMQKYLGELVRTVPHLQYIGLAETVAEALEIFERDRPNLVVLDLVLRAGSGMDVLREIKQRDPACRVVVFTSHAEPQYRKRCLADGADAFFSKSMEHRELQQYLRTAGDIAPSL